MVTSMALFEEITTNLTELSSTEILDYQIRPPKAPQEKPGVLFLLHGYGSQEMDLFSFADYLPDQFMVISLRAPLSLGFGGYAWYSIHFNETDLSKWSDNDEALKAQAIILDNIEHHCEHLHLDKNNVHLLGFSQGAILSWAVGLSHPHKIKSVIALSGYVNKDITTLDAKAKNLLCFSSHGTQDPTLPVEWARDGVHYLTENGLTVTYKEYPAGHGIVPENFQDVLAWMKLNL